MCWFPNYNYNGQNFHFCCFDKLFIDGAGVALMMSGNLYNNLSICVSPCVCPNAIYSSSFGQIWTLKVPMDSLGPGGGNKTICKVMGPEMKKKYYWGHLFWFYYLPSLSSTFVCLINFFTPFPSSYFISKHRFGLLGPRRR